jgi:hypothetical protein
MFKPRLLPSAAIVATFLLLAGATSAPEAADAERDFSALSCKEVMRLSGSDRDISLAFAHGYVLGKKGTTRYNVDALAQVTDQFIDHCLDNPAANALHSFEKFAM